MNYDNSTLLCIYDKQFSKQILFLTFDVLVVLRNKFDLIVLEYN